MASGKVRELYEVDEQTLLLVASDRISAFDHVLSTPIPDKGRVLTAMSVFWFELLSRTESGSADASEAPVAHHLVSARDERIPAELRGRALLVRRMEMVPVECVARGYLSGGGTKEYERTGSIRDVVLPAGLVEGSQLPEPVFTPSTKAEIGEHDEPVRSFRQPSGRLEQLRRGIGEHRVQRGHDRHLEMVEERLQVSPGGAAEDEVAEVDVGAGDGEVEHGGREKKAGAGAGRVDVVGW